MPEPETMNLFARDSWIGARLRLFKIADIEALKSREPLVLRDMVAVNPAPPRQAYLMPRSARIADSFDDPKHRAHYVLVEDDSFDEYRGQPLPVLLLATPSFDEPALLPAGRLGDAQPPAPAAAPIDMVLHCPVCGVQHIDEPEPSSGWSNPPHRSHKCGHCGCVWRPADVETNGVAAVKTRGAKDTYPRPNPTEPR